MQKFTENEFQIMSEALDGLVEGALARSMLIGVFKALSQSANENQTSEELEGVLESVSMDIEDATERARDCLEDVTLIKAKLIQMKRAQDKAEAVEAARDIINLGGGE